MLNRDKEYPDTALPFFNFSEKNSFHLSLFAVHSFPKAIQEDDQASDHHRQYFRDINQYVMKILFSILMLILVQNLSFGQNVSINTNGDPAHPTAMLDITSTDKGILIPRMAGFQRAMIVNPAQGLLVYDTDSRSFWFYDGQWKEIASGNTSGPAGGDLSGNYPTPNVVKIQNLDVAFGVPNDKQVLKWDALANNWMGRNDSLFLPYNASYGNAANLFGITNNNTTPGSAAIFGRSSSSGSGINPGFTKGVWGDNGTGAGVLGTSGYAAGVFGSSIYYHGITGFTGNENYAGVYGSSGEANGIGVMGELEENGGTAILGRHIGVTGIAGMFETPYTEHMDNTLVVQTQGLGTPGLFTQLNTANTNPVVDLEQEGNGNGIKIRLNKNTSSGNGVDAVTQGGGIAVYGKSQNGIAAKFENTNTSNSNPPVLISNQGAGTSLYVSSTNTGITGPTVDVLASGDGGGLNVLSVKGKAGVFTTDASAVFDNIIATTAADASNAVFTSNHLTSLSPGVLINQAGKGNGLRVNLTNAANTFAGVYVNTAGNRGMDVISAGSFGITVSASGNNPIAISANTGQTANNAIAIKGVTGANIQNGIGVLGQAGVNDSNGIGVKGIAGGSNDGGIGVLGETSASTPQAIAVKGIGYSHNEDVGAIMGINMVDGVGVLGESLGFDGIGIAGIVGNTNNHSVAAMFKNNYTENNRAVTEIISNGKGNGIFMDLTSLTNSSPALRIRNAGTGSFIRMEDGLADLKVNIEKDGDIITDGTIKVKTDKGIVRSTTSTQLRMEIVTANIPSGSIAHYDEFNAWEYIEVDFSTPFSSAPAVSIGNLVSGGIGLLTMVIEDVTTTGCTIVLKNYTGHDWSYPATTYKLIAVGAE